MKKSKIFFICDTPDTFVKVYGSASIEGIASDGNIYSKEDVLTNSDSFADTEFIFSTWGFPTFTEEEISALFPKLRAIFYAAGSVQYFARPFFNHGIKIYSARKANAIPVAEFTLSQILLANKGYFQNASAFSNGNPFKADFLIDKYTGNYNASVGIIGVGEIGRKVIEFLKPFSLNILAYDAFLSEKEISTFGAQKASLEEIFSTCNVISNHLADNPQTKNFIKYDLLKLMPPFSTIINTGREGQLNEDDLIRILREREDITALLDVTSIEHNDPPITVHPLFDIHNCYMSRHISGSSNREVARMGDYMKKEYFNFISEKPCDSEVKPEMLNIMA